MSKRILSGIAVSALALVFQPSLAPAQQFDPAANKPSLGDPTPSQGGLSGGNNSSNYNPVYDVSAAAGRAAFAQSQYDQASAALTAVTYHLHNEFYASNDYRSSVKAVDEARAAYENVSQPVIDQVHQNPDYIALIARRDRVDEALKTGTISPNGRIDLATRKMQYAADAAKIENAALHNDPAIRQARAKLDDAIAAQSAKVAQFNASLYTNPTVVEAKEAYDAATSNLAGARAALDAALLARADTVDADQRRYSQQNANSVYDPYYGGYYGWGSGYGGIVIIRHTHDNNTGGGTGSNGGTSGK